MPAHINASRTMIARKRGYLRTTDREGTGGRTLSADHGVVIPAATNAARTASSSDVKIDAGTGSLSCLPDHLWVAVMVGVVVCGPDCALDGCLRNATFILRIDLGTVRVFNVFR